MKDSGSFITGGGANWLIAFTKELRRQLPPPYLISHAPQPQYMAAGQGFDADGGYKAVDAAVGTSIDFYSVSLPFAGLSFSPRLRL